MSNYNTTYGEMEYEVIEKFYNTIKYKDLDNGIKNKIK